MFLEEHLTKQDCDRCRFCGDDFCFAFIYQGNNCYKCNPRTLDFKNKEIVHHVEKTNDGRTYYIEEGVWH